MRTERSIAGTPFAPWSGSRAAVWALLLGLFASGAAAAAASTCRVLLLDEQQQALAVRLQTMEQAEHSIDLLMFGTQLDAASAAHHAVLRNAARRGVRARVVLDAMGSWRMPTPLLAHFQQEGVAVRLYHPWRPWRPRQWTRRMHDKLMLVDEQILLIGGRNLSERFFAALGTLKRHTLDREILLQGPAALTAGAYFEALWNSTSVSAPHTFPWTEDARACPCHDGFEDAGPFVTDARRRAVVQADLDRVSRALDSAYEAWGQASRRPVKMQPIRETALLLHGAIPPSRHRTLAGNLHDLLQEAQTSILIEMPYLVPTRAFMQALQAALERGVAVQVITNSLNSTMNLLAHAAYVNRSRAMARMGIELYEYRGPESLHTKTLVLDERITILGSYNINRRSEALDTETMVLLDDVGVAAAVTALMEERMARADRFDPGATATRRGIRRHPGAPLRRRAVLRGLRMLAPLVARQI